MYIHIKLSRLYNPITIKTNIPTKTEKYILLTCLYIISVLNTNIPTKLEKIIKPQAIMYLLSERMYRI